MKIKHLFSAMLLTLTLIGCGGGGGNDSTEAAQTTDATEETATQDTQKQEDISILPVIPTDTDSDTTVDTTPATPSTPTTQVSTKAASIRILGVRSSDFTTTGGTATVSFAAYDGNGNFINKAISKDNIKITNLKVEKVNAIGSRSIIFKRDTVNVVDSNESNESNKSNESNATIIISGGTTTTTTTPTSDANTTSVPSDANATTTSESNATTTTTNSAEVVSNDFVNNTATVNDVVIDIDSTGSMRSNDPQDKRLEAAKKIIDLQRGASDSIAIVDFDSSTTVLSNFTNDNTALKSAIDRVNSSGDTYMNKSLLYVMNNMLADRNNSKSIVILTDGQTYDTGYHDDVIARAKELGVTIYVIALGDDFSEFDSLESLASETGGLYARVDDADGLDKIYENFGIATLNGSQNVNTNLNWGEQGLTVDDKVVVTYTLTVDDATAGVEIEDIVK